MWLIRCQICIGSVTGPSTGFCDVPPVNTRCSANDGMNADTGSFSSKAPSSHSIRAATQVIGFVIE